MSMKKMSYIVTILLSTGILHVNAQRSSIVRKDFNINDVHDSANIVVIKTNDIPLTLNKTLASENNQKITTPTTFYTNPAHKVHVVHVNNQRGNNTYVFQNNPQVILMLKPAKAKSPGRASGYATK